ncbi:hypothetical protein Ciccas_007659 [Cichlidogyrus casuarinus]|uniref:Uncharacterized protein n=1 Tax=Cichlidogyrus casuarinus TaxID=1844966 RepID=A0ABD2Q2B7_9PLAT
MFIFLVIAIQEDDPDKALALLPFGKSLNAHLQANDLFVPWQIKYTLFALMEVLSQVQTSNLQDSRTLTVTDQDLGLHAGLVPKFIPNFFRAVSCHVSSSFQQVDPPNTKANPSRKGDRARAVFAQYPKFVNITSKISTKRTTNFLPTCPRRLRLNRQKLEEIMQDQWTQNLHNALARIELRHINRTERLVPDVSREALNKFKRYNSNS